MHPVPSECSSQKYLYILYLVLVSFFFFFCLLKIVLQVLASFDIKITIMCKTLTMEATDQNTGKLSNLKALDSASFPISFHFSTKQNKQTNESRTPLPSEKHLYRARTLVQGPRRAGRTCRQGLQQHILKRQSKLRHSCAPARPGTADRRSLCPAARACRDAQKNPAEGTSTEHAGQGSAVPAAARATQAPQGALEGIARPRKPLQAPRPLSTSLNTDAAASSPDGGGPHSLPQPRVQRPPTRATAQLTQCPHSGAKEDTEEDAKLTQPQRTRVCGPGAGDKNGIQVPRCAGQVGGPTELTVSVLSLVPSSGPFALVPAASWAAPSRSGGDRGEGGSVAGPQAGTRLSSSNVVSPTVLPERRRYNLAL